MFEYGRPSRVDQRRPWSALTITATALAMVVAGAGPAAAQVRPSAAVDPSGAATGTQAAAKITAEATKQLKANKSADFWIKFATKADLAPAYKIADSNKRGQFVYDTLRATAKKSQTDVIAKLKAAGATYKSFWINNSIYVEDGTLDMAQGVAASSSVAGVHQQFAMAETKPVKAKAAGPKTSAGVEWGIGAIHAPEVWDSGVTGQGITVASFDTGVDVTHPALRSKYRGTNPDGSLSNDYNWFDIPDACGGNPCPTGGEHGTHTTGTMVGADGANQIGVAPGAKWIAANCIDADGCSFDDYLADAQWFLAPTRMDGSDADPSMRPDIINNSWGIPPGVDLPQDWMSAETQAWNAAGIFGAWAAGNEGPGCSTARFPGEFTHTYAAGAYDVNGNIASFSARGPGRDNELKPNIAAPGVDVRSSVPGGYADFSGTSMATPHLAGAVALLWSASPAMYRDIAGTAALLDRTAVDTSDTSCGGTAGDNNVWGEGKLDAAALVEAAPTNGVGTLTGKVTDAEGAPIAGARVVADGEDADRTVLTGADGTYSAKLPVGDYAVSAGAFGYLTKAATATITEDTTTTVNLTLEAAPSHKVSGTITAAGAPVRGAKVTIAPQIEPVTTGADGTFTFPSVPEGTYELVVTAGGCNAPFSREVVVDGDETVPVTLAPKKDAFGYTCAVSEGGYLRGTTRTPLTGDDVSATVALPFSFPFYDGTYTNAFVSSNGYLNFLADNSVLANVAIPSAPAPNAAVYPFWDDLLIDAQSGLYTGTTTVGGKQAFTLEWRDVFPYESSNTRVSFSTTLVSDGTIVMGYGPGAVDGRTQGNSATIGIENAAGSDALQYSSNAVATHEGLTITYDAPAQGTVSGVIRDFNTKAPIQGAKVTATNRADGARRVATTGADGAYAMSLLLGSYDLVAEADNYESATGSANLTSEGQAATFSAELKAGRIAVNKESISATLGMGESATRTFQVSNTGSAPVRVDIGAGSGSFVPLGSSAAGAAVIKGVEGPATVAKSVKPSGKSLSTSKARLSKSGAKQGASITPRAAAVPLAEQTITHSASQEITTGNSVSCNNGSEARDNKYLRTFKLSDFGINGSFDVSQVQFGVELTTSAQPLSVNLYSLVGDLRYANMTPIGSKDVTVGADAGGTVVTVPVEGSVPAGGTLVVEIDVPAGGWFFIGSNDQGQTAPSYIASDTCNLPEPTDTADIDFPGMHMVINVSGATAGGGGVGWLDIQPKTVTLKPGARVQVTSVITANVDQPGTYGASIGLRADTPYSEPSVSATLNVKRPAGWGKIAGTVTGAGAPLPGAVHIDGLASDATLVTGADGTYGYWMPASNAPVQLTVAANGYVPQTRKAQIVNGQTTVYDFNLTRLP
ncbi:carboxypeptidase regulatory-like domain-containing protein [Actinoplanes sp. NPDC049265]|uniref:carboxypeptidase regulatory-like domain-containing protein n=1 Tax=Actinoplanes sp. NPDC049265 TaxID=3363902 RepID=UPI003718345B